MRLPLSTTTTTTSTIMPTFQMKMRRMGRETTSLMVRITIPSRTIRLQRHPTSSGLIDSVVVVNLREHRYTANLRIPQCPRRTGGIS